MSLIKLNKPLKLIQYSKHKISSTGLFKTLDILPFNLLTKHRIGIFMFKFDRGISPACIKSLFKTNADTHSHGTRGKLCTRGMRKRETTNMQTKLLLFRAYTCGMQ